MPHSPLRFTHALLAAAALSACGRSEPVQPVAAPDATVDTPAAPAAEAPVAAAEPEVHDHGSDSGGAAHVHGLADLAITREGNRYLVELISPMANFGLAESDSAYTDVVTAELSGLVEIDGGECEAAVPHPMTDNSGAHTDAVVHFVWTCAKPEAVRRVRFAGFEAFPAFETVSAVYITEANQKAASLTPAAPELALN